MRTQSFVFGVLMATTLTSGVWAQNQPQTPPEPPAVETTEETGDAGTGDAAVQPSPEETESPPESAPATPAASSASAAPQGPALSDEARAQLGSAPGEVTVATDTEETQRLVLPPLLLLERGRDRATTVVFPLFYSDRRGETSSLLIPPYYQHRSPTLRADVVFPVFFHWRGQRSEGGTWGTDVVPPFYYHSWQGRGESRGTSLGLAPLFFYGDSFEPDGSLRREHLIIPPLLTVHTWTPEHTFTLAGPFFYDRLRSDTDWGVAPIVFGGNSIHGNYVFIPPLLTYHSFDRDADRSLTVVGPFWHTRTADSISFNLAPIFSHRHDRTSSRTTLAPLFHIASDSDGSTLATPLFYYGRHGESSTFVSWVYQNHRGSTNWDAVAPFFYSSREPATGAHTEALLPLFYHRATQHTNTWWVTPLAHYEREGRDWFFNIYPVVFTGRTGTRTHAVIGPLYARFTNSETRSDLMMVTPMFWRYSDPESLTVVVPPVLYTESTRQGVRGFEWHILPLFSYGRPRPSDVSWNVLFGLVGYRRSGTHRQLKLFWAPIDL
jgi:hypothetical protein